MKPHLEEAWRALWLADRDITAFKMLLAEPPRRTFRLCSSTHSRRLRNR